LDRGNGFEETGKVPRRSGDEASGGLKEPFPLRSGPIVPAVPKRGVLQERREGGKGAPAFEKEGLQVNGLRQGWFFSRVESAGRNSGTFGSLEEKPQGDPDP
jgi:hypothetical protein